MQWKDARRIHSSSQLLSSRACAPNALVYTARTREVERRAGGRRLRSASGEIKAVLDTAASGSSLAGPRAVSH